MARFELGRPPDENGRVSFEPELETLPREQLRDLQADRLRALIGYVRERVPLYRERLADVEAGDIASIDDLAGLAFTRKDDLRDTYPFGMLAVPREELVRIHASSGTTGKLTVVGYTAADLDLFARVTARSLAAAGAEPGMTLHNAYGYGLFTGGLGLHDGGERLGMTVVPVSGGLTERQLMLIADYRPEVICCTPSYALTLAQAFAERGVTPDELSVRYALLGAEPVRPHARAHGDDHRPHRRHADHPRRQRLPDAGRGGATAAAGADAELPDRRQPQRDARRGRGGGRGERGARGGRSTARARR